MVSPSFGGCVLRAALCGAAILKQDGADGTNTVLPGQLFCDGQLAGDAERFRETTVLHSAAAL